MTEKQFSALRTTIIGAAFFIGGALLYLEQEEIGVLFMALGGILMLKDAILSILINVLEGSITPDTTGDREKEEQKNESD